MRESATQTFACGRTINVLADEVGDHTCECATCREKEEEARAQFLARIACNIEKHCPEIDADFNDEEVDCTFRKRLFWKDHHFDTRRTMLESLATAMRHIADELDAAAKRPV